LTRHRPHFLRAFIREEAKFRGMTIWILALSLFVLLGIVGYNQGAIRVAFSLLGLVVASMLAMPLGPC